MQNRVELHLHMDGSLSKTTVNTLVNKNYHVLTDAEKALFEKGELFDSISGSKCDSLSDYLKKFDLPCRLLQQPEDVATAFENLVKELAEQGVLYAEIRFAPQLHSVNVPLHNQLAHEMEIVEAAILGINRGKLGKKIVVNIILCCMRNLPDGIEGFFANERNIFLANEFLGRGVCAIDLAGAEARDATSEFESIFKFAKKLDIPFTIHAGESGDPAWMKESLESAIEFGAKRIGHGVGLMYSLDLQKEVCEKGITVECCLKSNLDTKAINSLVEHPAKWLYNLGIHVTLNTDNMTVSSTNLANEYELAKSIGFTERDIAKMQDYALVAAFMTESQRKEIKKWIKR